MEEESIPDENAQELMEEDEDFDDEEDSESESEEDDDEEEIAEEFCIRIQRMEYERFVWDKPPKLKGKARKKEKKKVESIMECPLEIQREFRVSRRFFYCQLMMLEEQRRRFAAIANSYYKEHDYRKAACCLAAAYVGGHYHGYRQAIENLAGIGSTSYDKYRRILRSLEVDKDWSVASLNIKVNGRPTHYSTRGDALFWQWLTAPERKIKEKTMDNMIEEYERITGTEDVTRQHISFLLHQNQWRMVTPKSLDVKRCVPYKTYESWFKDPELNRVLRNVDPRLLFNADETDLNRKRCGPRWVAAPVGTQPTVFTKDHSGSHVTLFLIVSASCVPVFPFAVVHGSPKKFYDDSLSEYVRCYPTKKGYMTKFTFEKIITELFIDYVQHRRLALGLPANEPAALIVDGHNSRYNSRLLRILAENCIDLIILPAHTSHKLQPLDLTLNKLIKEHYRGEFPLCLAKVLEKFKKELKEEAESEAVVPSAKRRRGNSSQSKKKKKSLLELKCERIAMIMADSSCRSGERKN